MNFGSRFCSCSHKSPFSSLLVSFPFRICNFFLIFCSCSLFDFVSFFVLVLVGFYSSTQVAKFWKNWLNVVKLMKKLMKTRLEARKNHIYTLKLQQIEKLFTEIWKKMKNSGFCSYLRFFKWHFNVLVLALFFNLITSLCFFCACSQNCIVLYVFGSQFFVVLSSVWKTFLKK